MLTSMDQVQPVLVIVIEPSHAKQQSALPSIFIHSVPGPSTNHGSGGTAHMDGSYETSLVIELCNVGGMTPCTLGAAGICKKKSFPAVVPTLIGPVLLNFLEDRHPWIKACQGVFALWETCDQAG